MFPFSYLEPVCCSMSSSNCCFLTCIQVSQEAGQVVCYAHLFQNFPQFIVIHTDKGFGIVNKAEIDDFLELFCFFNDPADIGNLISGSFAFSKTSLNIWKFTGHVLLKPGLENYEHYFTSIWDECNCAVVWAFFGIAFLQDWNENWPFPVLRPLLKFAGVLSAALSQHHLSGFQIAVVPTYSQNFILLLKVYKLKLMQLQSVTYMFVSPQNSSVSIQIVWILQSSSEFFFSFFFFFFCV